jgi:hypothetical protein
MIIVDKARVGHIPSGYRRICGHMIYAVKHDDRHKSQLFAGGHLMDPNTESVYSSAVLL